MQPWNIPGQGLSITMGRACLDTDDALNSDARFCGDNAGVSGCAQMVFCLHVAHSTEGVFFLATVRTNSPESRRKLLILRSVRNYERCTHVCSFGTHMGTTTHPGIEKAEIGYDVVCSESAGVYGAELNLGVSSLDGSFTITFFFRLTAARYWIVF
jgi:hypothetical protein